MSFVKYCNREGIDNKSEIFTPNHYLNMGYEFDINNKDFFIKVADYNDIGSNETVPENVIKAQKEIPETENYIKYRPLCKAYVWNEKKCLNEKIDLRHILVRKIINRLERINDVNDIRNKDIANHSKKDLSFYEDKVYENTDILDKSFSKGSYHLYTDNNNIKIPYLFLSPINNKIRFTQYNEFCAFGKPELEKKTKPKRIYIEDPNTQKKQTLKKIIDISNKFFKKEGIRVIFSDVSKTTLMSVDEFAKSYFNGK